MAIKHVSSGHQHMLVDSQYEGALSFDSFEADFWRQRNAITGQAKGRGTTLFLHANGQNWVLRHYRRGGLPGKILSDQYFFSGVEKSRPFCEFRLLFAMREMGLNVPQPIAARTVQSGLVYRGDLITAMIPGSNDLHAMLCNAPIAEDLWRDIGIAVAKMHRAGVYHHDLNVRNVMVDGSDTVWIIDFDRCEFRDGDSWKSQNIARFLRSLEKEKNKNKQFHWQKTDWDAFIDGLMSA